MKLYREVKNRKADYCAWPINEDLIHEDHVPIEPIEITEVTRELWKNHCSMGNHGEYMSWDDFVEALSKLSGDE